MGNAGVYVTSPEQKEDSLLLVLLQSRFDKRFQQTRVFTLRADDEA